MSTLTIQQQYLQRALHKQLYKKSFYDFVIAFWPTFEPVEFIDGKLIKFYCEVFQYFCKPWIGYNAIKINVPDASEDLEVIDVRGDKQNLCLNVPPRHTKSDIFNVLGPTWLFTNEPVKVASISHTSGLAKQMNAKRKDIINSELYQDLYGDEIQLNANQTSFLQDKRGAELYSLNRNAMTGYGADVIVNDDLTNAETARKDMGEMLNAWSYYQNTMPSRINNVNKSFIMNVQQRLAVNDITGMIRQNPELAKTYKFVVLPAIFEKDTVLVCPISGELIYYKKGEGLWPERFGDYSSLRSQVGSVVFETQYMQHPLANDDTVVKEHHIIKKPITEVPSIDAADMVYASHDFPVKDKKESDFLGSVVAYRVGSKLYIKSCKEAHMEFTKSVAYCEALDNMYPGIIQIIEDKANGSPILQQLEDRLAGLQAYSPGTASKTQRLESATLYMESKNVIFVMDEYDAMTKSYVISSELQNLIDRLLLFPLVAHDDIVDAFSMLVNFVFMDRRYMVYGRSFNNDNIIENIPDKLFKTVFLNKNGDQWKACEIGIQFAERSKIFVTDCIEFKASMAEGIDKLKEWKPNMTVCIDCSQTEALFGLYSNSISFEHYNIDDFDKSVSQLNLAFSRKECFIHKSCVLVKNDIELFKFTRSQHDTNAKYRSLQDGFVACIRMALKYNGITY